MENFELALVAIESGTPRRRLGLTKRASTFVKLKISSFFMCTALNETTMHFTSNSKPCFIFDHLIF